METQLVLVSRFRRNMRSLLISALAITAVALLTPAANALTITYTATGLINLEPENAKATFTTGANDIMVSLTNLLADPHDAGQLLSDLTFTTSSAFTSASLKSSSGVQRTVASNHTFTDAGTAATGWGFTTSPSTINLLGLSGANTPRDTIIGPPAGGGTYASANASIAGNGPHNPFVGETANFDISATGVTAATTITSATFSFTTIAGQDLPGSVSVVPEPSTLMLYGTALAGLPGALLWRRRLRGIGFLRRSHKP